MDNLDIVSCIANFVNPKILNGVCKDYYLLLKDKTCLLAMLNMSNNKLGKKGYSISCYYMSYYFGYKPEMINLQRMCTYPKLNGYALKNFYTKIYYKRGGKSYKLILSCSEKAASSKFYLIDLVEALNLDVKVTTPKGSKVYTPSEFVKLSLVC